MSILTEVSSELQKLTENKNARLAISAFVISTLVLAVALVITSIRYTKDGGLHFSVPADFQFAFVALYLVLFLSSWFILHLLNRKDATDVYSEVREKLEAGWIVSYGETHGAISNDVIVPVRAVACKILVNAEQKLVLSFTITRNPIFEDDQEGALVRDVAIRYNDSGGYTMFYYYKAERELQPQIAALIAPQNGMPTKAIEVEIFGRVNFDKPPSNKDVIKKMSGTWFDLNGNTSRLFALLDMKQVFAARNERFEPIQLSQIPIHPSNFDADMGTVTFDRV